MDRSRSKRDCHCETCESKSWQSQFVIANEMKLSHIIQGDRFEINLLAMTVLGLSLTDGPGAS